MSKTGSKDLWLVLAALFGLYTLWMVFGSLYIYFSVRTTSYDVRWFSVILVVATTVAAGFFSLFAYQKSKH